MSKSELENLAEQKTEEESVSEKRRKILRTGDWVGISIQRPLRISFASPRKEENIGKRRKVTDGHRARYSSKQIHITSPFPTKSRLLANRKSSQIGLQHREPARTDVRISIGGKIVPPGVSSSSAPRRIGSHSTNARRKSQTISSDVMLLDAEASVTQDPPRMAISNLAASRYPTSVAQVLPHSPNIRPINTFLVDEVGQGGHKSYEAEDIGHEWARTFSETVSERREDFPQPVSHQDFLEVRPERQNSTVSPINDYSNSIHPGRLIFSSSSTSIHHPAPRSSRVSVLLRSASSDIANSTVAQIGMVKPVVPSSQILENEIWETWVVPEQSYVDLSDNAYFNENEKAQGVSISPGISTRPAICRADTTISESEDNCSPELQRLDSEELAISSDKSNVPAPGSSEIATGSSELPQQEAEAYRQGSDEVGHAIAQANQEFTITTASIVLPDKKIIEEGQNDSWTKFLFGGIGDEVGVPSSTPKRDVVPRRRDEVFGTSMLGQASGDGSDLSEVNAARQDTSTPAASSTISGGASRNTEASPFPSESRYREPNMEMTSTVDSPSWKGSISVQAERGSFLASSSESVPASIAVQVMSHYSASGLVGSASLYRPQRKVTFTKPKPFIGRQAKLSSLSHREPLHIGRGLMDIDKRIGSRRNIEREVYGSDEQDEQEEVESIEDD
jgi:hypothetical protein